MLNNYWDTLSYSDNKYFPNLLTLTLTSNYEGCYMK